MHRGGDVYKYRAFGDNHEYPVAKWAQIMKIERIGYYAWLKKQEFLKEQKAHIKKRIKEEFEKSRGTYGPDRITAELRKKGEHLGRKRCAEYMAEMKLDSCHNRHRARSLTNSKKARGDGYQNILRDQEFPIVPRMGLSSDITYLRTDEGFMYHCVIRDIVTGEVLGDHMADRMTKELIHWTHYSTKESVRVSVFEYIYCFYNVKRIQKRLGYMSPREYFRSLKTDRLADVA
jgi:transposase InsO family protein